MGDTLLFNKQSDISSYQSKAIDFIPMVSVKWILNSPEQQEVDRLLRVTTVSDKHDEAIIFHVRPPASLWFN